MPASVVGNRDIAAFACRGYTAHRIMREMDPYSSNSNSNSDHGADHNDRHAIDIISVHAWMTIPALFQNNQHDSFGGFSSGSLLCGNGEDCVNKAHLTTNLLVKARTGMVKSRNKSTSELGSEGILGICRRSSLEGRYRSPRTSGWLTGCIIDCLLKPC